MIRRVRLLAKLLTVTLVIAVAPQVIDGITVDGIGAAAWAAVVYGFLTLVVGWLVSLVFWGLSIVPGVLTLGLFFLIVPTLVHTVLLKWTAGLVDSFHIASWGDAFWLGLLLGLSGFFFDRKKRSDDD